MHITDRAGFLLCSKALQVLSAVGSHFPCLCCSTGSSSSCLPVPFAGNTGKASSFKMVHSLILMGSGHYLENAEETQRMA